MIPASKNTQADKVTEIYCEENIRHLLIGVLPNTEDGFGLSASAPTFSFFLFSGMRYTLPLAFINMEVLESRNSHPDDNKNRKE